MTIVKWHKNDQKKNTLTYSVSKSFGGQWQTVLSKAINEFNQQMTNIGVKLSLTPVAQGMGPHIVFETEPGSGLHGSAPTQTKRINGKLYNDTVKIRVPATPRINPDDPKSREVGQGVRLALLVHEMIHAVGLDNDEHTKTSDDVFSAKTVVVVKGTYVKGVQVGDDLAQPHDGSAPMPPIRIGAATIAKLKEAWTGDQTP